MLLAAQAPPSLRQHGVLARDRSRLLPAAATAPVRRHGGVADQDANLCIGSVNRCVSKLAVLHFGHAKHRARAFLCPDVPAFPLYRVEVVRRDVLAGARFTRRF